MSRTIGSVVGRSTAPRTPWLAAGDHAHRHALGGGQHRHVGRGDVAVGRRLHLVLGGEVDPELEARHAARLLLRHLRMDDAAAGGHPLHAARLEQADVADAVAVAHAALEHDRHGLEAAVRMVGKAADVVGRGIAAEGVEHQERVEPALQRLGQDAGQADAGAVGGRLAADGALDAARAEGGGRRWWCSWRQCTAGAAGRNDSAGLHAALQGLERAPAIANARCNSRPHRHRLPTSHEALLQPRRLLAVAAHRPAAKPACRSRPSSPAPRRTSSQDGTDYYTINPKGYVPTARARRRQPADRGPGDRPVPRRPGAGEEAGAAPHGTMPRYRLQEWLNFITSELHKGIGGLFNPAMPEEAKALMREKALARLKWVDAQLEGKAYTMGDAFTRRRRLPVRGHQLDRSASASTSPPLQEPGRLHGAHARPAGGAGGDEGRRAAEVGAGGMRGAVLAAAGSRWRRRRRPRDPRPAATRRRCASRPRPRRRRRAARPSSRSAPARAPRCGWPTSSTGCICGPSRSTSRRCTAGCRSTSSAPSTPGATASLSFLDAEKQARYEVRPGPRVTAAARRAAYAPRVALRRGARRRAGPACRAGAAPRTAPRPRLPRPPRRPSSPARGATSRARPRGRG